MIHMSFISLIVTISIVVILILFVFFFFKQETAYEMRISDWSSDVCSSDLLWPYRRKGSGFSLRPFPRRRSGAWAGDALDRRGHGHRPRLCDGVSQGADRRRHDAAHTVHGVRIGQGQRQEAYREGRKRVGCGQKGSVREDLGSGVRINKKRI